MFENVCELVAGNIEALCISKTKLDPSLPNLEFLIPGFRNLKEWMLVVWEECF